jgi:hypothetical protein
MESSEIQAQNSGCDFSNFKTMGSALLSDDLWRSTAFIILKTDLAFRGNAGNLGFRAW